MGYGGVIFFMYLMYVMKFFSSPQIEKIVFRFDSKADRIILNCTIAFELIQSKNIQRAVVEKDILINIDCKPFSTFALFLNFNFVFFFKMSLYFPCTSFIWEVGDVSLKTSLILYNL